MNKHNTHELSLSGMQGNDTDLIGLKPDSDFEISSIGIEDIKTEVILRQLILIYAVLVDRKKNYDD